MAGKARTAMVVRGTGGDGKLPTWVTAGLDWDLKRVTEELAFLLKRTVEDMFEVGRRLIWVQHQLGPGSFEKWLADNFHMSRRSAFNFIGVARKFGPLGGGIGESANLHSLGRSKLYALLEADESEIKRYLKEGKLYDLEADEVDRMTVAELREAVRRNRKNKRRYQTAAEQVRALKAEIRALTEDTLSKQDQQLMEAVGRVKMEVFDALSLITRIKVGKKQLRVKAYISGALDEIDKYIRDLQYEKCGQDE